MIKFKKRLKEEEVKITVNSISQGHHKVTYRGIKAVRCPFDYVIYQMIINKIKPDLVIEIGTNSGGGALYIADLMDIIGKGKIHTIDIVDEINSLAKGHSRIEFFCEGWKNYDLKLADDFETILIIDDASHLYEDTIGILNKFNKIVSKDSYFIIEDGIINELGLEKEFNGGPLKAIREFVQENSEFEIDRNWCDMFGENATFNVNGYLKKIKKL